MQALPEVVIMHRLLQLTGECWRRLWHGIPPAIFLIGTSFGATTSDYELSLSVITDYENIRPLIFKCSDLGRLERNRPQIEAASDLEDLRGVFEKIPAVTVRRCPPGITGKGIKELQKTPEK